MASGLGPHQVSGTVGSKNRVIRDFIFPRKTPLAVLSTLFGAPSEIFIRRHVKDLLPRKTAFAAGWVHKQPAWDFCGPSFLLEKEGCERGVQAKRLMHFFKRHGVETVLGEYMDYSLDWFLLVRKSVRFFVHAHGFDVSVRLREPEWTGRYQIWKEAGGIIVPSEAVRTKLITARIPGEKIHVIPYGVDVPELPPAHPESVSIKCVAAGRFTGKKAPLLVLEAFREALADCSALELDYAGDGELMSAARAWVQEKNLSGKVRFHGSCPNEKIIQLMKEAHIFLQHSITNPENGDQEGLPVAILEAMAQGLPVVSTVHSGIPEAVEHGVSGFLVPEKDTARMAAHIVTLAGDPSLRASMGRAGWLRARERFTWEQEKMKLSRLMDLKV